MATSERHQEQPDGGPTRKRIGAASTRQAHVSVKGVLRSASVPQPKPPAKGVPVLPFVPRPSLAQTLGHAPLPTDEFAAVIAGKAGRLSLLPNSMADAGSVTTDSRPGATAAAQATPSTDATPLPIEAGVVIDDLPARSVMRREPDFAEATLELPAPRAISPGLAQVIQAWPDLPPHIRTAVISMIQSFAGR